MTHRTRKMLHRLKLPTERRPAGAAAAAIMLAAFTVVVLFAVPKELPIPFQRLAGLVHALLAALVAVFAMREFGGRYNRIRVSGRVFLSTSTLLGMIVFAAVLAWWLSDYAPIRPI